MKATAQKCEHAGVSVCEFENRNLLLSAIIVQMERMVEKMSENKGKQSEKTNIICMCRWTGLNHSLFALSKLNDN